ncbi:hypothetical protein C5L14_14540 [Labrys okinawensis]|uniref:Uncharacterized protein n=1 Tax=Labrys okinawensis TaxID=346911 RepID=A0A2S9QB24_9HYPH|nr:hypothetical protein [Labrys okinawensis]PRH86551.1 hypothetical protein C5L14_14540 [Labrys okinawensis]
MSIDPKALFADEVVPATEEEAAALDGIIRDCDGDPYKAALTLYRLFTLQSAIMEARGQPAEGKAD